MGWVNTGPLLQVLGITRRLNITCLHLISYLSDAHFAALVTPAWIAGGVQKTEAPHLAKPPVGLF